MFGVERLTLWNLLFKQECGYSNRLEDAHRRETWDLVIAALGKQNENTTRWLDAVPCLQHFDTFEKSSLVKSNGFQIALMSIVQRSAEIHERHLNFGFGFCLVGSPGSIPPDCGKVFDYMRDVLVPKAKRLGITNAEFAFLKALALFEPIEGNHPLVIVLSIFFLVFPLFYFISYSIFS